MVSPALTAAQPPSFLKCAGCWLLYDEASRRPLIIPGCGHSACSACLQPGAAECPVCNWDLSTAAPDSFKANQTMVEALRLWSNPGSGTGSSSAGGGQVGPPALAGVGLATAASPNEPLARASVTSGVTMGEMLQRVNPALHTQCRHLILDPDSVQLQDRLHATGSSEIWNATWTGAGRAPVVAKRLPAVRPEDVAQELLTIVTVSEVRQKGVAWCW
eukprot:359903-Chlamydomonas_euryale.AAC.1